MAFIKKVKAGKINNNKTRYGKGIVGKITINNEKDRHTVTIDHGKTGFVALSRDALSQFLNIIYRDLSNENLQYIYPTKKQFPIENPKEGIRFLEFDTDPVAIATNPVAIATEELKAKIVQLEEKLDHVKDNLNTVLNVIRCTDLNDIFKEGGVTGWIVNFKAECEDLLEVE